MIRLQPRLKKTEFGLFWATQKDPIVCCPSAGSTDAHTVNQQFERQSQLQMLSHYATLQQQQPPWQDLHQQPSLQLPLAAALSQQNLKQLLHPAQSEPVQYAQLLVQEQALRQPSKQLPQPEAPKQPTLLQKTGSHIPAVNAQISLNANAAAFEPSQLKNFSFHSSLGTERTSQKVISSNQVLTTIKAPDMSALKASAATAPESKNGPDSPCMIGSAEPKQQPSQGDNTTASTEQLNPQYPAVITDKTWITNGMRHF